MITIINMLNVGQPEAREQIWIVPGSLRDRHDDTGPYSDWYIEDYLRERGILVGINLDQTSAKELIEELKRKFEAGGIGVVVENAIND